MVIKSLVAAPLWAVKIKVSLNGFIKHINITKKHKFCISKILKTMCPMHLTLRVTLVSGV